MVPGSPENHTLKEGELFAVAAVSIDSDTITTRTLNVEN